MNNPLIKMEKITVMILSSLLILVLLGCKINSNHSVLTSDNNYEKQVSGKDDFPENISARKAYELIEKNDSNIIILDVRTQEEYNEDHIANSIHYDFYSDSFKHDLRDLDMNKTYIVYCRVGRRSGETADMMKKMGFKILYNIEGGIISWKENSLPVVK